MQHPSDEFFGVWPYDFYSKILHWSVLQWCGHTLIFLPISCSEVKCEISEGRSQFGMISITALEHLYLEPWATM